MEKEIKTKAIECHHCKATFEIEYKKEDFGMSGPPVWMAQSDDEQCPNCDSWMVSPH